MEYCVEYTTERCIRISVKDGRVVVKAPKKTTKERIESLLNQHKLWIKRRLEEVLQKKRNDVFLTDEFIKKLKIDAKDYLINKIELYSKIMEIKYGRIRITSARKRLGSCNSNRDISLSCMLMLYPESAREYVVVHELAHIKEMNHSPKFYKVIESVLPDYKERKKLLKTVPDVSMLE